MAYGMASARLRKSAHADAVLTPADELAAIRRRDARAVHGDDMDPDHMQAITDRGRLLEYIDEMQARGTA